MTFNDAIKAIDTCRVYHSGPDYFVEIDIVVDGEMPLWKAHDIAQVREGCGGASSFGTHCIRDLPSLFDRTCKIRSRLWRTLTDVSFISITRSSTNPLSILGDMAKKWSPNLMHVSFLPDQEHRKHV
jgi:hypothetical protein